MPKILENRGKDYVATNLTYPFQWVLWVLFLAIGSCCQFLESNLLSWQWPGLFGDFFWSTTQLNIMQFQDWELHLVTRDGKLGLCPLFGDFT